VHTLEEYFTNSSLFRSAIDKYERNYVNNPRRDWALTGEYGRPETIFRVLTEHGAAFLQDRPSLRDLTASHYRPLLDFMERLAVVKAYSNYAQVPISKFLHILNPRLFPIYDERNFWQKVMGLKSSIQSAGVFNADWNDFCDHPDRRGIPLHVQMKRN